MRSALALCTLLLLTPPGEAVEVYGIRMWAAPDNTRLVLDLSAPVEYHYFTINSPQRVVLDVENARLAKPVAKPMARDHFLHAIRHGEKHDGLRLVLDLKRPTALKGFLLKPRPPHGHRLVLDLLADGASAQPIPALQVPVNKTAPPAPDPNLIRLRASPRPARAPIPEATTYRKLVVAIDAGHGGEDPGATGTTGAREKDLTLAIARKLARQINREPGMRAVMIRDGDYFIALRERIRRARNHKADMFVSIHADAYTDPAARGSSVYVLSRNGASSEAARWLAERENAADLVGGVRLEDKDEQLKAVLLDLSQHGSMQASLEVGRRVLGRINRVGKLHHNHVQRAGFAVLKSPDIPSILVETAFISNPAEERKLLNPNHQAALAQAVLGGLRTYFREAPPPGTEFALQKEVEPTRLASSERGNLR
ncbi:MAG: N-acetylmuramoyl-L-alanine amidase [Gammaproteobacteria bacterium]